MKRTAVLLGVLLMSFDAGRSQSTLDAVYTPRVVYLENMASRWGEIIKSCDPPLDKTGYDPRCTVIVTSWQPMVWQVAPGKWQISFVLPKK